VTWSASSDNDLSGYNVYRSTQSDQGYERQTGVEGTTFTTGQTTYVDSGLTGGAIYFYRITVVTTTGESDQSAFAGATVSSDSSPPTVPTFFDGDAVTDDPEQLNLTWRAPSEDEDGGELTGLSSYQIYRAASSSGTFELVGTSTEAAFTDTGLAAVTTYFYQVEALDAALNISLRSATLELTTSGVVMPSDVRLVSTTSSDAGSSPVVTISWTASTGAILRYEVQRTTVANSTNDADYTDIVPNNSDTSRQDSTVTRGQTYYYRVRAEDVDNRFSDWTTPLAVTVSN
jgi:fibronectin type 3 domain-containing protein